MAEDLQPQPVFVCVFRVGNQFFVVVVRGTRVTVASINEACFKVLKLLGVEECDIKAC